MDIEVPVEKPQVFSHHLLPLRTLNILCAAPEEIKKILGWLLH